MGRPVGTDKARAVYGKTHGKILQGHIMNNLVIGALQKGRIYRGKGLEPFRRQPGGKGYAMLFGDADIEAPRRKHFGEFIKAGA